jgi:hypothetical protein
MTLRTWLALLPLSIFLMHCGDEPSETDGTGGSAGETSSSGGDGPGGNGADAAGGSGAQGGTGASPSEDTIAPTVVAASPSDGAVGVTGNTNIVIQFSEPMDKVATQAAYQSAEIPAGSVTFTWNSEGTMLTIDPVTDLAYATGPTPDSVMAQAFSFTLSDLATDEAGNALAEPETVTFSTLRRIEHSFAPDTALCGFVRSNDGYSGTFTYVGDNIFNGQYKGFATMDITALPEAIVTIEEATLRLEQMNSVWDDPYGDLGGTVNVHHVVFATKDLAALSAAPLSVVGVLSTDLVLEYKEISVLAQLEDDYANRDLRLNRSQYRLELPVVTDFDETADTARFDSDTSELLVRYLIE